MIEIGKATEITVHIGDEQALYFAARAGEYFMTYSIGAEGYLTIRSGGRKITFAAGQWQSIESEEYQLKRQMN